MMNNTLGKHLQTLRNAWPKLSNLAYHQRPLSFVFLEDKPSYLKALNDSREKKDIDIFRNFMMSQQIKFIEQEIEKYRES